MVEIRLQLVFETLLNIGSGAKQGTLAQRGMIKDRHGWPYIPATTLKGRLRHAVEQVSQTLKLAPPICLTHHDMCRRQLCAACQLFGSPWAEGLLRFTDLTLVGPPLAVQQREESGRPPRTTERTGVTLNRARRVAEDAFLYDTELLWPGIELTFGGRCWGEMERRQAALVVAGLYSLPALGRGKSGGRGYRWRRH